MIAGTCTNCAAPLSPLARFCTTCGTQAPSPSSEQQPAWSPTVPLVPAGWALQPIAAKLPGATAALVLGILSWALMLMFVGFFTSFITAPIAVGLGASARRRDDAEPGRFSGRGNATAGFWLGMSWLLAATVILSLAVAAALANG